MLLLEQAQGLGLQWFQLPEFLPDNSLITPRQLPDKNLITIPDRNVNQSHAEPAQERISATGQNNCVISKQVSEYTSSTNRLIGETKTVQNQTNAEWLDEYQRQWALECDDLF